MANILGIIGGSGLYEMDGFQLDEAAGLKTPFGDPSDKFMRGRLFGCEVVFLPRHGVGHRINPSELNYRANIWGMKKLGVSAIISISAVGSMREEIKPGDMVVIDQFFDRTQARAHTFFEDGIVAHVSFADPLCPSLRADLIHTCAELNVSHHPTGTYLCMEGPQFSTRAESKWYRESVGAHVVGMTNLTEAKLAREAEICYATLALSTDYDCWREGESAVTTEMVIKILQQNVARAQEILSRLVGRINLRVDCSCHHALEHALLTKPSAIADVVKIRLGLFLGKYLA